MVDPTRPAEVGAFVYRADGWPLCPRCGEDDLISILADTGDQAPVATDPLQCLNCHWSGTVPAEKRRMAKADLRPEGG